MCYKAKVYDREFNSMFKNKMILKYSQDKYFTNHKIILNLI